MQEHPLTSATAVTGAASPAHVSHSNFSLRPSYQPTEPARYHHDYRARQTQAQVMGGEGEDVALAARAADYSSVWRELQHSRAAGAGAGASVADLNLLANSLSSRLRRAAALKEASTAGGGGGGEGRRGTGSGLPRQDPGEASSAESRALAMARSASTATTTTTITIDDASSADRGYAVKKSKAKPPQSILKRPLSKEEAERNQRILSEQYSGSRSEDSSDNVFHLPELYRYISRDYDPAITKPANRDGEAIDAVSQDGRHQSGSSTTPRQPEVGGTGHDTWIKRAGVFQPADKYAQGRQPLHGDDVPYALYRPVDYKTVTLRSKLHGKDDEEVDASSGLSGKASRRKSPRKGLKVSWKYPAVTHDRENTGSAAGGPESALSNSAVDAPTSSPSSTSLSSAFSGRQRSADSTQSDLSYSFHKPRFSPGRSRVPVIGLRWKVFVPTAGKPAVDDASGETKVDSSDQANLPSSNMQPSLRSPSSSPSSPTKMKPHKQQTQHPQQGAVPFSSCSTSAKAGRSVQPARDGQDRTWRAQLPHDVHPVTTAMEREGTSVSKTKWHVPATRKVPPAYVLLEDLLDSRLHQWTPVALHNHAQNVLQQGRRRAAAQFTARATVDGVSLQQRLAAEGDRLGQDSPRSAEAGEDSAAAAAAAVTAGAVERLK